MSRGQTSTLGGGIAALLFVALFVGGFYVGFGTDHPTAVVWEDESFSEEGKLVACLRDSGEFERVEEMVTPYGAFLESRTYLLSSDASLHFGDFLAKPDQILVRAQRQLTSAERKAMEDCVKRSDRRS